MFILQLIGALIVLIIETLNKMDFQFPMVYYYYRFGTALEENPNPLITIEHSRSLVYQLKALLVQQNQLSQNTYYLYLSDDYLIYKRSMDCALQVHLHNNQIFIIDYNNYIYHFRYQTPDIYDIDSFGFNKQIEVKLLQQSRLNGRFQKSSIINDQLFIITQIGENIQYYIYSNSKILEFTQNSSYNSNQTIILLSNHSKTLVLTQSINDVQYIQLINSQFYLPQIKGIKLYHLGQYLLNIPIFTNDEYNQLNFISITVNDYNSYVVLQICYFEISLSTQIIYSTILFNDDLKKIYNHDQQINYARYENQIYIIIGQHHYYIRPQKFSNNRFEIKKINCNTPDIILKNRIIKLKMTNYNLLIQLYNPNIDMNVFYYLNLQTISFLQDISKIQFIKFDDPRQSIHKNAILDYQLIEQQQGITEVLFIFQSGDLLIGQLQYPFYVQIFEYAFGQDIAEEDFSTIKSSKFWIAFTLTLIVIKIYPYFQSLF